MKVGVQMKLSRYGKRVVRNILLILIATTFIVYSVFFSNIFKKVSGKNEPQVVSRLEDGFVHGLVIKTDKFEGIEKEELELASKDLLSYIDSLKFSVLMVEVNDQTSSEALEVVSDQARLAKLPLYLIDRSDKIDPKDYKKFEIKDKATLSDSTISFGDYEGSLLNAEAVKKQNASVYAYADVLKGDIKGYVFSDYDSLENLALEVGLIASNLELNQDSQTDTENETTSRDQTDRKESSGQFHTIKSAAEFFSNAQTAQIGFSNKPVIKGIEIEAALASILSDPNDENVIKSTTVKGSQINVVGSTGSGESLAYELSTGDYLMAKYTKEIPAVKEKTFTAVTTEVKEGYEVLQFKDQGTPMPYIFRDNDEMVITFVGSSFEGEYPIIEEGLFTGLEINNRSGNMELRIPVDINDTWGYLVDLSDNTIKIRIKNSVKEVESFYQPLSGLTVVLDAGHGGKDPGSLNPKGGTTEAQLNLEFSSFVEDRLVALGAKVVNTRTDDTFVSLWDRVNIFNDNNGDYFVSVHHNASVNTGVNGVEMYYAQDADKKLAESLSKDMSDVTNRKNRGPYQWRQYVLRSSLGPSVLIEAGFVSEDKEFIDLQDETKQILSAGTVADNIAKDLVRRVQVAK